MCLSKYKTKNKRAHSCIIVCILRSNDFYVLDYFPIPFMAATGVVNVGFVEDYESTSAFHRTRWYSLANRFERQRGRGREKGREKEKKKGARMPEALGFLRIAGTAK